MKKIILSAVDPRDFMGATVFDKETQQNKPANLQDVLTYLNESLAFHLLRFERVDDLGAYSIPSETGLLIPSDFVN